MRAVRPDRKGQNAAALAELAILSPVLLFLLTGVAQIGIILASQISIDTAAREGSRVASQQPNNSQAYQHGIPQSVTTCPGNGSNPVCAVVVNSAGTLNINQANITIQPTKPSGGAYSTCGASVPQSQFVADGYVQVAITYNVPIFVPFAGPLLSTPGQNYRQVTATSIQRTGSCGLVEFTDNP
jgi:Flp pilus assembly protein TadG